MKRRSKVETAIVIADESKPGSLDEARARFGPRAQLAHVDVAVDPSIYHFRLVATIALAEISRQVGRGKPGTRKARLRTPVYDRAFELVSESKGIEVSLEDLVDY